MIDDFNKKMKGKNLKLFLIEMNALITYVFFCLSSHNFNAILSSGRCLIFRLISNLRFARSERENRGNSVIIQ